MLVELKSEKVVFLLYDMEQLDIDKCVDTRID